MKKLAPLLLALVLAATPAAADPLSDGLAAYKAKDYQKAYELLLPLAEAGDMEAQHHVGWMLADGLGRERDVNGGVMWLQKAAEQGLTLSLKHLGLIYMKEKFGVVDEDLAVLYLSQAAIRCHANSAVGYGTMLTILGARNDDHREVEGLAWMLAADMMEDGVADDALGAYIFVSQQRGTSIPYDEAKMLAEKIKTVLACF